MIGSNLLARRSSMLGRSCMKRERGAVYLPALETIEERSGFHEGRTCGARAKRREYEMRREYDRAARTWWGRCTCRPRAKTHDGSMVCRQGEGRMQMRARHDGICHFGRRFGGDSHCCDNGVSSEGARALGRHSNRNKQLIGTVAAESRLAGFRLAALHLSELRLAEGILSHVAFVRYAARETAYTRLVRRCRSESGQGTIEYALVMFGFLSIVAGLGALWNMLGDGMLTTHALMSASHHVQAVAPGAVADVFAF